MVSTKTVGAVHPDITYLFMDDIHPDITWSHVQMASARWSFSTRYLISCELSSQSIHAPLCSYTITFLLKSSPKHQVLVGSAFISWDSWMDRIHESCSSLSGCNLLAGKTWQDTIYNRCNP